MDVLTSSRIQAESPSDNELHTCDEEPADEAEALVELADDLAAVDTVQIDSDTVHFCPRGCFPQFAFSLAALPADVAVVEDAVDVVEDSEQVADFALTEEEVVSDWLDCSGRLHVCCLQCPPWSCPSWCLTDCPSD